MEERLKKIREYFSLNQREFAKRIDVGTSTLALFETGSRKIKDIHIKRICTEFGVNEIWLRTGEGEMFIAPEEDTLIARAAILLGEKDLVFESFVDSYSRLTPTNRKALLDFLIDFSETLTKKKE